jgi:diguanylate cyclase (GGDEF)-like protein/PAS domain S-box-containing protein
MNFKLKNRIAIKQARTVLLISLLLGLFSTSWQIFLDLKSEKQRFVASIDRIILLHQNIASQAIYDLNQKQADDIVSTLISYPEIYKAAIIDDFGDELSESAREPTLESFITKLGSALFQIDTHIITPIKVEDSNDSDASLTVDLDTTYIADSFASRTITTLVLGLFHNIILACIFLLLFYLYLSQPIVDIVQWVNQLRLGKSSNTLPYTQEDEIGELVSSFAALWQERVQITDQLSNTIDSLSKSENFSRELMENAGDALFLCKPDTTIVQVNNQASGSIGLSKDQILGQKIAQFSKNYTTTQLISLFQGLKEKQATTLEDVQINTQGKAFPIEARIIKLTLQDEHYILILARDISVRKKAEQQIFELAFFDPLTALPNRRLFVDRLVSSLQLHQSNNCYGAILYLDLDRFKTINDSLGHGVGDTLLCQIAARLTELLPEKSTCSRFGGDEFVVLLPEVGTDKELSAEAAAQVAKQIIKTLHSPFDTEGHTLYCTASIGISMFPTFDSDAMDIIRSADTALYRAKAMGRNDFQFFDQQMQSSAQERLDVEKGLHLALQNDQFELWFQPQVNHQGEIIGAEALLRWIHPEKGIITPEDYIKIAEDSGQIIEIGNWVLDCGLKQLATWRTSLPESFHRLAINISPIQFMQVNFVEHLFKLMQETKIPGHMIELEITENMLLNNFEIASKKMKLLKQRGISFAIDDFGTGYSSLQYLRHLPLDILKIDRSFVTNLRPSSEEAAIIEVIITIADRLNLVVIAEGVETIQERDALKALGCHCFQGYLFFKPLPVKEFEQVLQQNLSGESIK